MAEPHLSPKPLLLIMRHGKSDWSSDTGRDHDRPLARRGIEAARRIGAFLSKNSIVPDHILSSTALRALTTAELTAEACGFTGEIKATSRLYGHGDAAVLDEITSQPSVTKTLMVVGHEPWVSSLTSGLIGNAAIRFPTAAVSCIAFEVSGWHEIPMTTGQLRWFMIPRLL